MSTEKKINPKCSNCQGTGFVNFGDSFHMPCRFCYPLTSEPQHIVLYAIKNPEGEYFCGIKPSQRKSPGETGYSPNVRDARLYPILSTVKGMVKNSPNHVVRLDITISNETPLDFS